MKFTAALCATVITVASSSLLAADTDGRFAVKSAGGTRCSQFVDAVKTKDQRRLALYVGWIAGYISAANQLTAETFDHASWQDMRTLTALLSRHCDRNADTRFGAAVAQMVTHLKNDRLQAHSDPVVAEFDGKSVRLYVETLRRAQDALAELGMYSGSLDGKYTDSLRESLTKFQGENDLPTSGIPDQQTLFALFQKIHNKSSQ